MNAYDKIYLEDATHNLGVMVDCAVNTLACPAEQFWNRFLASGIAWRFSHGAVDIIAWHSGIELALMVFNETGWRIDTCDTAISISSKEYWAGGVLAQYQWKAGLSFKDLTTMGLGLIQTLAMFNPLHEADQTTFDMVATDIIKRKDRDKSWLKTARKINGITQERLSEKSGVPIRLIRAYEQGKINMSNAEFSTIMRLKIALNCVLTESQVFRRDILNDYPPSALNGILYHDLRQPPFRFVSKNLQGL